MYWGTFTWKWNLANRRRSLIVFHNSTFLTPQCQKIPDETVQSYLKDLSNISTTQILMLLYVLTFNDYIIAFKTEPKLVALGSSSPIAHEQTGNFSVSCASYFYHQNSNIILLPRIRNRWFYSNSLYTKSCWIFCRWHSIQSDLSRLVGIDSKFISRIIRYSELFDTRRKRIRIRITLGY